MLKIVDKKIYEIQIEELELCKQIIKEYKDRSEISDNLIAQQDDFIKHLEAEVYKYSTLVEGYKEKIKKLEEEKAELKEAADWYAEQAAGESR